MNFKTKAIGLLAGSALALSVASGAMAVDGDTDAVLSENLAGACALGVSFTPDADFGSFTWSESDYTGGTSVNLNVPLTQSFGPSHTCTINVSASDLSDGTNTIDKSSITISGGTASDSPLSTSQAVTYDVATGTTNTELLTLTLDPAADDVVSTYQGGLTITLNNG